MILTHDETVNSIDKAGILDISPPILRNDPVWVQLVEAFETILQSSVYAPLEQLEKIRFLDPDTEELILQKTVRLLGFNPTQDVLDMSGNDLTRLVTQLPAYPDYNSTVLFEKFIDLLLNAITSVEYLYTRDYANFYAKAKGPLVTEGGSWFKTTHINLLVQLLNPTSVEASVGSDSVYSRIIDVFYSFSPATLVLNNFYFSIKDSIEYGYAVTLLEPELLITIDY
jgi:hypothetical protein